MEHTELPILKFGDILVDIGIISNPLSSGFLFLISVWIIVLALVFYAKSIINKDLKRKSIIHEYDPPEILSPLGALFFLTRGQHGRVIGDLDILDRQDLIFIQLYESGLLKKLIFNDNDLSLEYEVNNNIEPKFPEDKIFLEYLSKKIGDKGIIYQFKKERQSFNKNRNSNHIESGYKEIKDIWNNFWNNDLTNIFKKNGYFQTSKIISPVAGIFFASLFFGGFFGTFLGFIPMIGPWINALLLLPVIIYFLILDLFIRLSSINFNFISFEPLIIFTFFSFVIWMILVVKYIKFIHLQLTDKGIDLFNKLMGYREYLKTVDKDRLSFNFSYDDDIKRTHTTLSWLVVFKLDKDNHWFEWYKIHKIS